jgi:DNA-binding MarR family transcriptional regulator
MSRPYEAPEAPPEVVAIARYNDLVARNLRNSQVLEGLVESAGARITRATFEVLANIERRGPLRLSHLVQRMGVDQSTISRQVRPLEELGLIERTEDPDDRRAVWLTTTPVGQEVIRRVRERVNRNVEAALASWSPGDRSELGRLLDKFRSSVIELAMSAGFEDAAGADADVGVDAEGAAARDIDGRGTGKARAAGRADGGGRRTSGTSTEADAEADGDQPSRPGQSGNGGTGGDGKSSGPATATGRTVRDSKPAKATKAVKAAGAGGRTGDGARPPRGGGPRRVRGTGGAS